MSEAIIGLVGVVLGGLLTSVKDYVAYSNKKESDGCYAAVCIITTLDEYIQKCLDVVADDGTTGDGRPAHRTEQGEEFCYPVIKTPLPPEFASDINWRSIDPQTMYRILSLPNTARETNRYIFASSEYSGPPGYDELFIARKEGYSHLGLEASDIVSQLRKQYKIPGNKKHFWKDDNDLKGIFTKELDKIKKRSERESKALSIS